jgi:activator of HSP90 ATPase
MTRTIQHSVKFPLPPEKLYDIYLDSKKHTEATGAPAKISRRNGGAFTAFGGMLCGRNLLLVPGKMIVQAWRSTHFYKDDPDSILVLRFTRVKGGGQIDLVHTNVPPQDHRGVTQGWPRYYWRPWKKYIAGLSRK